MRNNSRANNLDWEFKLALYEEKIFILSRDLKEELAKQRNWGLGRVGVLGQSKQKKRLGML